MQTLRSLIAIVLLGGILGAEPTTKPTLKFTDKEIVAGYEVTFKASKTREGIPRRRTGDACSIVLKMSITIWRMLTSSGSIRGDRHATDAPAAIIFGVISVSLGIVDLSAIKYTSF